MLIQQRYYERLKKLHVDIKLSFKERLRLLFGYNTLCCIFNIENLQQLDTFVHEHTEEKKSDIIKFRKLR